MTVERQSVILYAPYRRSYIPGYLVELLQTASALRDWIGTEPHIDIFLIEVDDLDRTLKNLASPMKSVSRHGVFQSLRNRASAISSKEFKGLWRCSIRDIREDSPCKTKAASGAAQNCRLPRTEGADASRFEVVASTVGLLETLASEAKSRKDVQRAVLAGKSSYLPPSLLDGLAGSQLPLINQLLLTRRVTGQQFSLELMPQTAAGRWKSIAAAVPTTIRLMLLAVFRSRKRSTTEAMASLTTHGIRVGDLAASTELGNGRHGGQLESAWQAFRSLLRVVVLIHFARQMPVASPSFVTGVEPMYANWAVVRALEARGCTAFGRNGAYRYQVVSGDLDEDQSGAAWLRSNRQVPPVARGEFGHKEASRAARHLEDERRATQYLAASMPQESPDSALKHQLAEWYAQQANVFVVYLHDMRDGQLAFGITDIGDLGTWLEFSVKTILRDIDSRVLLRLHPMDPSAKDEANNRALLRLFARLSPCESERIAVCPGNVNLDTLIGSYQTVAIIHDGSVAASLVAKGTRTIASVAGPWGDSFAFMHLWRSKAELVELIRKAQRGSLAWPTEMEFGQLHEFVYSYRLKPSSKNVHDVLFSEYFVGSPDASPTTRFWMACELLHRASADVILERWETIRPSHVLELGDSH